MSQGSFHQGLAPSPPQRPSTDLPAEYQSSSQHSGIYQLSRNNPTSPQFTLFPPTPPPGTPPPPQIDGNPPIDISNFEALLSLDALSQGDIWDKVPENVPPPSQTAAPPAAASHPVVTASSQTSVQHVVTASSQTSAQHVAHLTPNGASSSPPLLIQNHEVLKVMAEGAVGGLERLRQVVRDAEQGNAAAAEEEQEQGPGRRRRRRRSGGNENSAADEEKRLNLPDLPWFLAPDLLRLGARCDRICDRGTKLTLVETKCPFMKDDAARYGVQDVVPESNEEYMRRILAFFRQQTAELAEKLRPFVTHLVSDLVSKRVVDINAANVVETICRSNPNKAWLLSHPLNPLRRLIMETVEQLRRGQALPVVELPTVVQSRLPLFCSQVHQRDILRRLSDADEIRTWLQQQQQQRGGEYVAPPLAPDQSLVQQERYQNPYYDAYWCAQTLQHSRADFCGPLAPLDALLHVSFEKSGPSRAAFYTPLDIERLAEIVQIDIQEYNAPTRTPAQQISRELWKVNNQQRMRLLMLAYQIRNADNVALASRHDDPWAVTTANVNQRIQAAEQAHNARYPPLAAPPQPPPTLPQLQARYQELRFQKGSTHAYTDDKSDPTQVLVLSNNMLEKCRLRNRLAWLYKSDKSLASRSSCIITLGQRAGADTHGLSAADAVINLIHFGTQNPQDENYQLPAEGKTRAQEIAAAWIQPAARNVPDAQCNIAEATRRLYMLWLEAAFMIHTVVANVGDEQRSLFNVPLQTVVPSVARARDLRQNPRCPFITTPESEFLVIDKLVTSAGDAAAAAVVGTIQQQVQRRLTLRGTASTVKQKAKRAAAGGSRKKQRLEDEDDVEGMDISSSSSSSSSSSAAKATQRRRTAAKKDDDDDDDDDEPSAEFTDDSEEERERVEKAKRKSTKAKPAATPSAPVALGKPSAVAMVTTPTTTTTTTTLQPSIENMLKQLDEQTREGRPVVITPQLVRAFVVVENLLSALPDSRRVMALKLPNGAAHPLACIYYLPWWSAWFLAVKFEQNPAASPGTEINLSTVSLTRDRVMGVAAGERQRRFGSTSKTDGSSLDGIKEFKQEFFGGNTQQFDGWFSGRINEIFLLYYLYFCVVNLRQGLFESAASPPRTPQFDQALLPYCPSLRTPYERNGWFRVFINYMAGVMCGPAQIHLGYNNTVVWLSAPSVSGQEEPYSHLPLKKFNSLHAEQFAPSGVKTYLLRPTLVLDKYQDGTTWRLSGLLAMSDFAALCPGIPVVAAQTIYVQLHSAQTKVLYQFVAGTQDDKDYARLEQVATTTAAAANESATVINLDTENATSPNNFLQFTPKFHELPDNAVLYTNVTFITLGQRPNAVSSVVPVNIRTLSVGARTQPTTGADEELFTLQRDAPNFLHFEHNVRLRLPQRLPMASAAVQQLPYAQNFGAHFVAIDKDTVLPQPQRAYNEQPSQKSCLLNISEQFRAAIPNLLAPKAMLLRKSSDGSVPATVTTSANVADNDGRFRAVIVLDGETNDAGALQTVDTVQVFFYAKQQVQASVAAASSSSSPSRTASYTLVTKYTKDVHDTLIALFRSIAVYIGTEFAGEFHLQAFPRPMPSRPNNNNNSNSSSAVFRMVGLRSVCMRDAASVQTEGVLVHMHDANNPYLHLAPVTPVDVTALERILPPNAQNNLMLTYIGTQLHMEHAQGARHLPLRCQVCNCVISSANASAAAVSRNYSVCSANCRSALLRLPSSAQLPSSSPSSPSLS